MAEKKNTLIIVESPTKAKTITRFLPSDCTVLASYGHIRALPENSLSIDIEHGYKPKFEIIEGKQKVISQIKTALAKADQLILATDEDREGESISWHLVDVLKPKVPYRRMVFHEITKKAILEAFAGGREIDMDLVRAQEARRILDRLYGYSISPILWKKLSNKTLSAGRVQSPGLRLIVDRERSRMAFKTGTFWDLKAELQAGEASFSAKLVQVGDDKVADGKSFDSETGEYLGKKNTVLLDENAVQQLKQSLMDKEWVISDVKEKAVVQRPAPPFTTSTLQQEGNRKLHLSAKDTMRIAQTLYEQGFITYMRTDSPALSDEGTNAARSAVSSMFGDEYLSSSVRHYAAKSANAQEAHEAIRPASVNGSFAKPAETGLAGRDLALYTMIFRRTLACQMAEALKTSTIAQILVNSSIFEASGMRIDFPGFIKVYVEGRDDEITDDEGTLPALSCGQKLGLNALESVSHETKMPVRYTEASLVQTLEKMGIGRPSTYAAIIDRILEKKYVIKDSNALIPTFSGFGVIQLLEGNFANLIDYDFTKDMEDDLDQIAKGQIEEVSYLKKFYEGPKGLEKQCESALKTIDAKKAKQIHLPQLPENEPVFIGPYGAYVTSGEDNISIPQDTVPALVTEAEIQTLKAEGKTKSANAPKAIGTDPDSGKTIYECTGRFGAYWQLGEVEGKAKPPRFSIPKKLQGKEVPQEEIMKFFSLPKVLGKNDNGQDVSIGAGKFGPYVVCDGEFRSVANFDVLFGLSLETAIGILAAPKPEKKSRGAAKGPKAPLAPVVDFGQHENKPLAIVYGRYGYYLKHGDKNYRLPAACKNDEAACKALSKDEAIACIVEKEK
ncbi:MAG: type I DNA topoisomerase [Sphaerochaetaceae bacterium]|nr:type I DNA topoisomerase [Sphaerochaetaceae bacterium]MDD3163085.1 type I DNA topoisomerase [Sphaerochaetaceae bacterium]MDD4396468.1 type I DNA topoisomerase [Sphaerochaetaceae bacterium]